MPRLRRYARTLVFERQAADDLVQTALERALAHWHQFDQRRDMAVWLLSIAHNAHLDLRRRESRMTTLEPDHLEAEIDAFARGGDPDLGLRFDLVRALQRLAPDHRDVLMLVGVEQLTYAEAAEVLQIPQGTVMSRLSRARGVLRQLLDGPPKSDAAVGPAGASGAVPAHLRRVI